MKTTLPEGFYRRDRNGPTVRSKLTPGWRTKLSSTVKSTQRKRRNVPVKMPTFNLPPMTDEDGDGSGR